MCGIFLSLGRVPGQTLSPTLTQRIQNRGPDCFRQWSTELEYSRQGVAEHQSLYLNFAASVLSLRGDRIKEQPLVDQISGSVLCWNGEAWRTNEGWVVGNDTEVVFNQLLEAASCNRVLRDPLHQDCSADCRSSSFARILQVFQGLRGPYAIVFYDVTHRRILFARDPLGRRSLLYAATQTQAGLFTLASVSDNDGLRLWSEVGSDGVYCIDLLEAIDDEVCVKPEVTACNLENVTWPRQITKIPWTRVRLNLPYTKSSCLVTVLIPPT